MTKKVATLDDFAFNSDTVYEDSSVKADEVKNTGEYYDHDKGYVIPPEEVNGSTQKMHVTFRDPEFRNRYHVQWVDESKFSEYEARGFQPVRREWIASSWCHALTGSSNDLSDKVKLPVGIQEGGATQYNILMFTTKELFDRMERAMHNHFNRALTSGDNALAERQREVLDTAAIRRKNGY